MTATEALEREALDMGYGHVELLDSAELAEGVLVLVYRVDIVVNGLARQRQVRTATYVGDVGKWSGIVSVNRESSVSNPVPNEVQG